MRKIDSGVIFNVNWNEVRGMWGDMWRYFGGKGGGSCDIMMLK